jgi:pyridoxine 4-dehydrogenase
MTNTTFAVGGDIKVRRLGFGAMRITGPGTWGRPATELPRERFYAAPSIWASSSSTRQTPTDPAFQRSSSPRLSPYDGLLIATKGGYERTGPSGESATG